MNEDELSKAEQEAAELRAKKLLKMFQRLIEEKGYTVFNIANVAALMLDEELEELMFSDPEQYKHDETHLQFYACETRAYLNRFSEGMAEVEGILRSLGKLRPNIEGDSPV